LVVIDGNGKKLSGKLEPSSEFKLHIEAYRMRQEINAVIHAHPPAATALTVAGLSVATKALPEIIMTLGEIPVCAYETTGTERLASSVAGVIKDHDAVLMDRHGCVVVGKTLFDAYDNLERLEWACQVTLLAQGRGQIKDLDEGEISDLKGRATT
jgi:L-fuculose-phosphate aldolase